MGGLEITEQLEQSVGGGVELVVSAHAQQVLAVRVASNSRHLDVVRLLAHGHGEQFDATLTSSLGLGLRSISRYVGVTVADNHRHVTHARTVSAVGHEHRLVAQSQSILRVRPSLWQRQIRRTQCQK